MPLGIDFTEKQLEVLQYWLPTYKEFCAAIAASVPDKNNIAKLQSYLSSILLPIIRGSYPGARNKESVDVAEIHLVFKHFFDQQIAAIDPLDRKLAQIAITGLTADIDGVPDASKRELIYELDQVKAKIEKYAKAKAAIYEMNTLERQVYIDEAKADAALIKFAQGVQDHVIAASSRPVNLTRDQLLDTYSELLNTYESPLLERGTMESAMMAEEVRLFQEEITKKLLDELKAALSTDLKFVAPMLSFIKLIDGIHEKFRAKHIEGNIEFLNTIVENTQILLSALEAITTILPYHVFGTPEALESDETAIFLAESLKALNKLASIDDPIQRDLITGLVIQQFVARLKALAPKPAASGQIKFPILIFLGHREDPDLPILQRLNNRDIGLLNQAGVLLAHEFTRKRQITGSVQEYELPYYLSVLSTLQLFMTGDGLKEMLKCLFALQTRFIEGLKLDELKTYQTSLFPERKDIRYSNFSSVFVHLDKDLVKDAFARATPEDRVLIDKFKLRLDKVINDRISELSPHPRLS